MDRPKGQINTLTKALDRGSLEHGLQGQVDSEPLGNSRQQASQSVAEAAGLKKILSGLGVHLENLSNETDSIAGALDEGSGAIARLDGNVTAVGSEVAKALQLPARRR